MTYEDRVIAYIDILGFKEMIDNTIDVNGNPIDEEINKINEIFDFCEKTIKADTIEEDTTNINAYPSTSNIFYFSDTIVISFKKDTESGVYYTIKLIQELIYQLIINFEILCRGAIVIGKLYHPSEKRIFGPAFIDAYKLENEQAKYPRIILSEEIIKLGIKNHGQQHLAHHEANFIMEMLKKDSDKTSKKIKLEEPNDSE